MAGSEAGLEVLAAREAEFLAALRAIDPDRLSPRAALETIYALRRNFLGDPSGDALDE
jgi:hypothetical protein